MALRNELGDFSSILCFKAMIKGVEETLGEDGAAVVFIAAGRKRGYDLAQEVGIAGVKPPVDKIASILDASLGQHGTRLCAVKKTYADGDKVIIETQETVCSAGEAASSNRKCTFTLGALWGALEELMGQQYYGEHTESVLRGGSSDTFVFTPR